MPFTDDSYQDRFQQAIDIHQSGNVTVAQTAYKKLLEEHSDDADLLHLLGVTFLQQGAYDKALALISDAIQHDPGNYLAYTNLGNVCQQLNKYHEAVICYDQALKLAPEHIDAAFNRGIALQNLSRLDDALQSYNEVIAHCADYAGVNFLKGNTLLALGRHEESLQSYERALDAEPHHTDTHVNRGKAFSALGQWEASLASFDKALANQSGNIEALSGRGFSLHKQGHLDTALSCYAQVLELIPDCIDALNNSGIILLSLHRGEQALSCCDRVIGLDTGNVEAHFSRGNSLQMLSRSQDALESYDRAIVLCPGNARAHNNRGNTLHILGRSCEAVDSFDAALLLDTTYAEAFFNRGVSLQTLNRNYEALTSYNRAIRISPAYTEAMNNRGNTLQSLQLFQEALQSYRGAQNIAPDYGDAHWNEALCRLKTGDFENGWPKYEWRWENSLSNPYCSQFEQPAWQGAENICGKTILLHAEQGLGDTIQFCRYALLVAALGAHVVLVVHPSLHELMKSISSSISIVTSSDDVVYDYHCPLMSLPLAFDTRLASIPGPLAYITSDPLLSDLWRGNCATAPVRKIGIVWSGNKDNRADSARSLPLRTLLTVLGDDAQLFSLQKELSGEDVLLLDAHEISHFEEQLHSFSETAALVEQMDLVISVDSAVAHLSAALGKPTWILLAHDADFRWLLGRRDSPWYPTVRLFRQPTQGDWESVGNDLSHELGWYFAGLVT